jgi:putative transposase
LHSCIWSIHSWAWTPRPQPGTSKRHPDHKCYPYLPRQLAITRASQAWAPDAAQIRMERGLARLTAVADAARRVVLARKVAITMEACHAREIIARARARCGGPAIVNTDQGGPSTAGEFTKAVIGMGRQLSMDGRGAWRDKMFVARLWRGAKYACAHRKAYDGVSAARAGIGPAPGSARTGRVRASMAPRHHRQL